MFILLSLLLNLSFAEELLIEKYCFSNNSSAAKAKGEMSFLLLHTDKIEQMDSCLLLSYNSKRKELIQRYIFTEFPEVSLSFSSNKENTNICNIKIEKLSKLDENSENVQVTPSTIPNASTNQSKRNEKEEAQIKTNGPFELKSKETIIQGQCRFINKDQYEINLTYKKEKIIPSNSNPSLNHVENSIYVTTSLMLTKGQKINIASVQKSPHSSDQKIEFPQSIKVQSSQQILEEEIFLSIE